MKDRRKRSVVSWSRFFGFTLFVVISCILFTGFNFSTFRLFRDSFHPVLISSWRNSALEAITSTDHDSPDNSSPAFKIRDIVFFPDQVLVFLKYPSSTPLFSKDNLDCIYFPPNSTQAHLKLPPAWVDDDDQYFSHQLVRCPIHPRGFTTSLALKPSNGHHYHHHHPITLPVGPTHRWDSLVYEAVIDRDNTTVMFVKGLNLRPERIADPSRYECVYGWDLTKPKFLLTAEAIYVAQEIVRCKTPLSVLNSPEKSIKVSVRVRGRGILHSVARPDYLPQVPDTPAGGGGGGRGKRKHEMCLCTMIRNQARFIREWVMYHSQIGVERWFIYDNNSDDAIEDVIGSLDGSGYKITRHLWPWIKTQEAGFAHCALRARESCEWVGFIDVDEFLYLPSHMTLPDVLRNESARDNRVGELWVLCHSFGPSGLKRVPEEGVTVGYTCRMAATERHKSIVRPEVLNSTLINVVHHFHVKDGFERVTVEKGVMVINHYKYQVWEVFKQKFYRRVATFVADWQNQENVGSKDRTPGLGTRAIEPPDWSTRFCEVTDTGIRDWVLKEFPDRQTKRLPWQGYDDTNEKQDLWI